MVQQYTDKWGIDPLAFPMFDELDNGGTNTRINASLEHNPQLVSNENYGSTYYWGHILAANGLVHPSEMKAGQLLVLPTRRVGTVKKRVRKTVL